jgi:hypothetical protein
MTIERSLYKLMIASIKNYYLLVYTDGRSHCHQYKDDKEEI